jgi:hypothetical protein
MIVSEPCGYAVLPLITIIQENRALRPDKKTACSSWCVACACSSPATTRRTEEEEEGGRGRRRKEGRKREGRKREGEGKGEERRKWDKQTGSTRPSRLPSSRWRHYRLFAICDLEGHSVSSHSLPPHEPPSLAGRPYRCVEISVRAYRERQLPSGYLLQLAICCHMPRCFPAISTCTDRGHHIFRTGRLTADDKAEG